MNQQMLKSWCWEGVLLLPHVSVYSALQVLSVGKSIFTLRALVGFLPCMDFTVFVQVIGPGEGLVTWGASKGLISCVCPVVTLKPKVTRMRESLLFLGTEMRFLPDVDSCVDTQVNWLGEGLCTLGAGVLSLAIMSSLVCLQVTGLRERFVTNSAGEVLLFRWGQVVWL